MADALYLDQGKSLQSNGGDWYRIIQLLGAGGNAVTYLVVATSGQFRGALFALKIFRLLSRPERRESFLAEVEFLKKQSHPAVMRVIDEGLFRYHVAGARNEYPFVVAEYLPYTLFQVVRANRSSMVERVSFSVQLLSALVLLEKAEEQVVHRDIKPQNIFVKGRSCVLGDFGLMKILDGKLEEDREIFKESIGPGMPFFYRTPDLVAYARNESALTTKTDVFQLGLVLSELFTGRNPMRRPQQDDILAPVMLEQLGPVPGQYSGSIAALLNRMLTIDPASRPSASDLMNGWMGLFEDVCARTLELEGRVF